MTHHLPLRVMPMESHTQIIGMEWLDDANCLGRPTEWFHPKGGNGARIAYAKARAVCAECTVRTECLTDAMTAEEGLMSATYRHGMRAGFTPEERAMAAQPTTVEPSGSVLHGVNVRAVIQATHDQLADVMRHTPDSTIHAATVALLADALNELRGIA